MVLNLSCAPSGATWNQTSRSGGHTVIWDYLHVFILFYFIFNVVKVCSAAEESELLEVKAQLRGDLKKLEGLVGVCGGGRGFK